METTQWLVGEVRKIPGLSIVVEPTVNIIGITTSGGDVPDLVNRLRKRGWATSLFDGYLRIAVMPHLNRELLAPFLSTLAELVKV
jgi:glutamate/tyrosine decarboxylase-like PLP-dependent enzyme